MFSVIYNLYDLRSSDPNNYTPPPIEVVKNYHYEPIRSQVNSWPNRPLVIGCMLGMKYYASYIGNIYNL